MAFGLAREGKKWKLVDMAEELQPPPLPGNPPAPQKADGSTFTCGVVALWLLAGAAAVWAFFIGLANTTTQGYAMSKKAILLQFAPGAVLFLVALPVLLTGIKRRRGTARVILASLPCALGAIFLVVLIVNLLGG